LVKLNPSRVQNDNYVHILDLSLCISDVVVDGSSGGGVCTNEHIHLHPLCCDHTALAPTSFALWCTIIENTLASLAEVVDLITRRTCLFSFLLGLGLNATCLTTTSTR
jgi:hypothetical protein